MDSGNYSHIVEPTRTKTDGNKECPFLMSKGTEGCEEDVRECSL